MTVDSKMFRVVVNTISNYTGSGAKHDNHSAFDPTDHRPIGDNCIAKSKNVNTRKEGCLPEKNECGQSLGSRSDDLNQSLHTSHRNNTLLTAASGTAGTTVALEVPLAGRRPIFKIESQELLPTRRPSLGSHRGSAGSFNSVSSRGSRKSLGRMHRERFVTGDAQPEQHQHQQPKRGLRSILKKTRPIFPARQQMHPHLDPMIQYRYLQQQQESMQRYQCLPQHRSLLQSTFSRSQTQRGTPPKNHDQRRTSQKALSRLESSRPLPTPPATKSVRWASYNEVLEIENVDELIQLGYYNGYDRELGWDYRDESLDESSSNDENEEDEDYTESDFDCSSSACTLEDEDAESQVAEDDLIQRLSNEGLLLSSVTTSLASSPTPVPSLQIPNYISNDPSNSSMTLPTLRKQSPQLRVQPVRPLRLAVLPLRMQGPSPQSSPPTSSSTSPRSPISPISPLQLPLPESAPLTASTMSHNKEKATVVAAPPKLDRTKILADVAERKRNGEGVFARRIQRDRSVVQEGRLLPSTRARSLSNASSTMSVSPPTSDIMSSLSTSSSCASSPPSPRRMSSEHFPMGLPPKFAKAF
ncbi:hypothetical protein EC968_001889 [Mortierella alpina]|nr:hypothetical protein EC968_001889 [Mortierella alpina]